MNEGIKFLLTCSFSAAPRCADTMTKFVTNRDFVEMVFTLPLPPSSSPFDQLHEQATLEILSHAGTSPADESSSIAPIEGSRRSFLVISIPVEHSAAPEDPPRFVRGKYASVEAVWETSAAPHGANSVNAGEQRGVEWLMAVQSDAGGRIPLALQEMSMPSQIVKDVRLFFKWAHTNKRGAHEVDTAPN